jgi:hypothetical protein
MMPIKQLRLTRIKNRLNSFHHRVTHQNKSEKIRNLIIDVKQKNIKTSKIIYFFEIKEILQNGKPIRKKPLFKRGCLFNDGTFFSHKCPQKGVHEDEVKMFLKKSGCSRSDLNIAIRERMGNKFYHIYRDYYFNQKFIPKKSKPIRKENQVKNESFLIKTLNIPNAQIGDIIEWGKGKNLNIDTIKDISNFFIVTSNGYMVDRSICRFHIN